MRKIYVKKELICPFNVCRVFSLKDGEENKGMTKYCESCEYVWNRNSTLMVEEGCMFLDENSEEYKEYELLHTPVCIDEGLKDL